MARLDGPSKRLLAMVHDVIIAGTSLFIAVVARYGVSALPPLHQLAIWSGTFMAVSAVVFGLIGLGRGMWRFASITDLRSIVEATTASILAFLVVMFIATRLEGFPRSTVITTWFVMIVLLGGPRLAYRIWRDRSLSGLSLLDPSGKELEQVLIIGAVREADQIIRALDLYNVKTFKVRGIIDYSSHRRGRQVRRVPILGDINDIEGIVERASKAGPINSLVLAAPQLGTPVSHVLLAATARLGLPLRRLVPASLSGFGPSLATVSVEDLLGRPPVSLDLPSIRSMIDERVVLITGAGGSIGSEIVRQVASLAPRRLVIVDHGEHALYEINQVLAEEFPDLERTTIIGDIRDRNRMFALFAAERPSIVFHAAALKHVPLAETNVCEAALTNVFGTQNVADAAVAADVDAMVLISTDKAIRPTSIMGATKRAAEAYCQTLDVSGVHTRFITVRFGNVLGSTGSVVPLFKRQILAGGPLTVTHPEMKRYFMTTQEATGLVLQAAAHGIRRPDQRGRIFVLDMGEPIRIVDLARTMISLAGLRPDHDIKIVYTGLRDGEKLFEELFDKDETTVPTGFNGIMVATTRPASRPGILLLQDQIKRAADAGDAGTVRELLRVIAADATEEGVQRGDNVVPLNPPADRQDPAGQRA